MAQVPIILETPTINHVVNVMKEREIDALVTPWVNAWVAHLLSVHRATAITDDSQAEGETSPSGYDKGVGTKSAETIEAYSSHVIHAKAERAYT